jgi:hypothetical protein
LQNWNERAKCNAYFGKLWFFFNFLTQIFAFFSSKHYITTREELSTQHSQRVGSYGQFQYWWTNSPKSLWNYMGPLYFDIRTPVFVMRTYIVRILNLSTSSEVRISNFNKYIYRVMRSEKPVFK